MEQDLLEYLRSSGYVVQSADAVSRDLHRWVRFLRANGVHNVPRHFWMADARTSNLITHLHFEATKDPRGHEHRNLIGIRPYKPVKVRKTRGY